MTLPILVVKIHQAMAVQTDPNFHRDMDRLIQLLDNCVPSLPVGPETLANAEQSLAELPALQARLEHVAGEAVMSFSYWRFWNLGSIGLDDQQLLFDWLKDKGVEDVKRDFRVLYETINILREEGLEVEHILKSEFDAVIREHDNPSRL